MKFIVYAQVERMIIIKLAAKKASEKTLGSLDFIVFIKDYSMIEATRPDPTVRPPSRFEGLVILLP